MSSVPVRLSAISALALVLAGHASPTDGSAGPPTRKICSPPGLVAHRGGLDGGVENTTGAFRTALGEGADMVELDVHFTKDHHPVLMHDATVDRTTTGSGRISGMTLADFRRLRALDGERPPTLATVMKLVGESGARMLVELKEVPDARDLAALKSDYRRLDAYRWAALMSFSPAALRAVRSIPAAKGLLSTTAPPASTARRYAFISVRHDHLTRSRVAAYHAAGAAVYAWTPDDPSAWRRLTSYGVDRVVTNRALPYLDWAEDACES